MITARRAARLLAAVGLAALACACATVERSVSVDAAAVAPSAPAPVADYDWHYNADEGEASLVFGMADSDDIMMGLSCAPGSGKLDMFAIVDQAREIHLESGGDTERFPAEAETSELHGGHILSAETVTDMPVFKRFRRLGWMASLHDGRRDLYVAHPETTPRIDAFFDVCG